MKFSIALVLLAVSFVTAQIPSSQSERDVAPGLAMDARNLKFLFTID
jgi:hypothetical protein